MQRMLAHPERASKACVVGPMFDTLSAAARRGEPARALPREGGAVARSAGGALDPRHRLGAAARLITRVVVRPGEGWVELEAEGALTAMLALGSGSRAETFASCSGSSVKVVAGARNHRELTPLVAAV